jgi:hypothetical protein
MEQNSGDWLKPYITEELFPTVRERKQSARELEKKHELVGASHEHINETLIICPSSQLELLIQRVAY